MRQSKTVKVEEKEILIKQLGASDKWLLESVYQELIDKAVKYNSEDLSKSLYVVSRHHRSEIKEIVLLSVSKAQINPESYEDLDPQFIIGVFLAIKEYNMQEAVELSGKSETLKETEPQVILPRE